MLTEASISMSSVMLPLSAAAAAALQAWESDTACGYTKSIDVPAAYEVEAKQEFFQQSHT